MFISHNPASVYVAVLTVSSSHGLSSSTHRDWLHLAVWGVVWSRAKVVAVDSAHEINKYEDEVAMVAFCDYVNDSLVQGMLVRTYCI